MNDAAFGAALMPAPVDDVPLSLSGRAPYCWRVTLVAPPPSSRAGRQTWTPIIVAKTAEDAVTRATDIYPEADFVGVPERLHAAEHGPATRWWRQ